MNRVTLTVVAVLLAVPAPASAKTGISTDQDPSAYKPGDKMNIDIIYMREPRDPMGEPKPVAGVKPLATFKSTSGKVVRVRGDASDSTGISHATVALPDRGPWAVTTTVGGKVIGHEGQQTFLLGGNEQVYVPPPTKPAASLAGDGSGPPWLVIALGAAAVGLLILALRAGVPGRLRTRFGGSA